MSRRGLSRVRLTQSQIESLGPALYATRGIIQGELEKIKRKEALPGDRRIWQAKLKKVNRKIRDLEQGYLPRN